VLPVLALTAVVGFLAVTASSEGEVAVPPTSSAPAPSTVPEVSGPEPTLPPDELVEIDRVWLIDRGDGVLDWGVSVRTPPDAPTRSGVIIEVRLLDEDDVVVHDASGVVDGIGPEAVGAVTGRLAGASSVPIRLEFDVAVGVESNDRALGDVLSVRALDRVGESVRGRIRSESENSIEDVTMVLLWLDEDGDVIATVPQAVEQIRPDVDLRFDIDLDDEVVPDGRPDSVVWTK